MSSYFTQTRPFNGTLSRTIRVSQYLKPIWILLKQETVSGSGISWALQTDNHASTQSLSFYRLDALPATQPTLQRPRRPRSTQSTALLAAVVAESATAPESAAADDTATLGDPEDRDGEWRTIPSRKRQQSASPARHIGKVRASSSRSELPADPMEGRRRTQPTAVAGRPSASKSKTRWQASQLTHTKPISHPLYQKFHNQWRPIIYVFVH